MTKKRNRKSPSAVGGAAYAAATGRRQMNLTLPPEEYERIKSAVASIVPPPSIAWWVRATLLREADRVLGPKQVKVHGI